LIFVVEQNYGFQVPICKHILLTFDQTAISKTRNSLACDFHHIRNIKDDEISMSLSFIPLTNYNKIIGVSICTYNSIWMYR